MLEKIIDKHKEMMYEFIDLTGINDYEFCLLYTSPSPRDP